MVILGGWVFLMINYLGPGEYLEPHELAIFRIHLDHRFRDDLVWASFLRIDGLNFRV